MFISFTTSSVRICNLVLSREFGKSSSGNALSIREFQLPNLILFHCVYKTFTFFVGNLVTGCIACINISQMALQESQRKLFIKLSTGLAVTLIFFVALAVYTSNTKQEQDMSQMNSSFGVNTTNFEYYPGYPTMKMISIVGIKNGPDGTNDGNEDNDDHHTVLKNENSTITVLMTLIRAALK